VLEQQGIEADGTGRHGSALEVAEASWLAPSALLLVGLLGGAQADAPTALIRESSRSRPGGCRVLLFDGAAAAIVSAPGLEAALRSGAVLELRRGETVASLDSSLLAGLESDLQTIVRRHFAPLPPSGRWQVVEFLAGAMGDVPKGEMASLSERLRDLRDALRERLPPCVISENHPEGLHVDRVMVVDDRSFYLEGWLHDRDAAVTRVTAVSPEGARSELLDRMYRYPRADVADVFAAQLADGAVKHGFLCFVELDAPSMRSEGWLLEMETSHGDAVEVGAPPVTRDATTVRDAIIRDPGQQQWLPDEELMTNHVYPAISRIQVHMGEVRIDRVLQFGTPPAAPEASIVVPVYKRLDHLEMQLAEFVHDPEISRADLIYVLDSPEQADDFLDRAAQLTPLYRVPFRVALLERNIGFAGANNAGASLARGRLLLLLNSDILPDRPGWLSRMTEFYDATPHIGALGVKLLYEDGSIQHAGMYFYQPSGSQVWQDAHYFKGMHRSIPGANVARRVPLVSGACLMIDRQLYQDFGGLRGIFVRGDYEDSDLCLQLMDSGRENWYLPDVELYHLEGQSYLEDERYVANRYNMWVHTHLWRDRIVQIMREHGGAEAPPG
jgi:GT2 family glycosyltransferase